MACERGASRRQLLLSMGVSGGTALLGIGRPTRASASEEDPGSIPFYGPHQAGITTAQQPRAIIASFDVLAENRDELARLFAVLTDRIAHLMAGGAVEDSDPRLPPPDSGLLGPVPPSDHLTITVAVGASLFDDRYGLAALRPRELVRMERFSNDALDARQCHGDLLLQICADHVDTTLHALRNLIRATPDLLALRWKVEGFIDPPRASGTRETPRNLLGFKDGTANLPVANSALMDELIWLGPNAEPAWTQGGSFMAVRIVRTLVERWDRTPLQEQERIFGRHKMSGAPLGREGEFDDPGFDDDPDGRRIALAAHIRRANPRRSNTDGSRILRRGYNFSRGVTAAGQLDMGLLFVSFQASLEAGFIAVQKRLEGEELEEYVKPVGGGYFFALPGVPGPGHDFAEGLLGA